MAILETFEKQPADVQDYHIDFNEWMASFGDTAPGPADAQNLVVTAEPGITVNSYSLKDGVVAVWLSGGTHGNSYKITATLETLAYRKKQAEIKIKVKEY